VYISCILGETRLLVGDARVHLVVQVVKELGPDMKTVIEAIIGRLQAVTKQQMMHNVA